MATTITMDILAISVRPHLGAIFGAATLGGVIFVGVFFIVIVDVAMVVVAA